MEGRNTDSIEEKAFGVALAIYYPLTIAPLVIGLYGLISLLTLASTTLARDMVTGRIF